MLRVRGLDKPAPPAVVAPIRAWWLGAGTPPVTFLKPSKTWGYACLVPEGRDG